MDPQDHGFIYGWSYYDLDGHHWDLLDGSQGGAVADGGGDDGSDGGRCRGRPLGYSGRPVPVGQEVG